MSFKTEHRCVACKKPMSWNTMMHSHGTCPNCGTITGVTVCDCTKHPYTVKPGPWWCFWSEVRIYKEL